MSSISLYLLHFLIPPSFHYATQGSARAFPGSLPLRRRPDVPDVTVSTYLPPNEQEKWSQQVCLVRDQSKSQLLVSLLNLQLPLVANTITMVEQEGHLPRAQKSQGHKICCSSSSPPPTTHASELCPVWVSTGPATSLTLQRPI